MERTCVFQDRRREGRRWRFLAAWQQAADADGTTRKDSGIPRGRFEPLIVEFVKKPPGKAPTGETVATPFYEVKYDFVLQKQAAALAADVFVIGVRLKAHQTEQRGTQPGVILHLSWREDPPDSLEAWVGVHSIHQAISPLQLGV